MKIKTLLIISYVRFTIVREINNRKKSDNRVNIFRSVSSHVKYELFIVVNASFRNTIV